MEKTRFTVAISAYNIEAYVKRAIDSVLSQTFTDYELLVIDDCSKDNTVQIIEEALSGKGIILKTIKNSGTAAASRNIAIDNAQGEYLLFLDGDDELYSKDTLKEVDELIKDNTYDIVYLGYENVGKSENYYRISNKENSTRKARLLCDESFSVSSKVWNVKFLREIKIKRQFPGALFSAVGWTGFSFFFSLYFKYSSRLSEIYGSLTTIVCVMLWLYVCMYIFLMGAEINLYVEQWNAGSSIKEATDITHKH